MKAGLGPYVSPNEEIDRVVPVIDAVHPARFDDIVASVIAETTTQAERAVRLGVPEDRILIDPPMILARTPSTDWNSYGG